MNIKVVTRPIFYLLFLLLSACGSDDTTIIIRSDFPANGQGSGTGNGSGSGASITFIDKSDGSIKETTDIDKFLEESPQE